MQQSRPRGGVGRLAAQIFVALIGVALIAAAAAADTVWVDRHFLPNYFRPHSFFIERVNTLRVVIAGIGLLILVGGPRWIARMAPGEPKRRIRQSMIAGAVVLIFGFGAEALLRKTFDPALRLSSAVPAKQIDARFGASLLPNQLTSAMQSGRRIEYATDANGARVVRGGAQLDLGVPTIIFVGDSTMMGLGLQAEESIP